MKTGLRIFFPKPLGLGSSTNAQGRLFGNNISRLMLAVEHGPLDFEKNPIQTLYGYGPKARWLITPEPNLKKTDKRLPNNITIDWREVKPEKAGYCFPMRY